MFRSQSPATRPLVDPVVVPGVQAATQMATVAAAYLLFAGHNQPGGGFAAGLMVGAILVLRSLIGRPPPIDGIAIAGLGCLIATVTAIVPIALGSDPLDQTVVSTNLPVLGTIKSGSALILDVGVVLVVAGLVVAVIDGLAPSDGPDE